MAHAYLVMEALEGELLGARLARDGALPWQLVYLAQSSAV